MVNFLEKKHDNAEYKLLYSVKILIHSVGYILRKNREINMSFVCRTITGVKFT